MKRPIYISVDIEAAGPFPGAYSMLTVGACLVDRPDVSFEANLKPTTVAFDVAALKVTGLSLETLAETGEPPEIAMGRFVDWIEGLSEPDAQPVFVGLNAAFDWAFVNHYFLTYIGRNPFGFAPLDIKALYMGATGCAWRDARSSEMRRHLHAELEGDHVALTDALAQAELFRRILEVLPGRHSTPGTPSSE